MKTNHFTTLFSIIVCLSLYTSCKGRGPQPTEQKDYLVETKAEKDQRMGWWREARFGMFIHWGLYAVPAGVYQGKEVKGVGEWIMETANIPTAEYEKYATQFNPTQYDAKEWVRIAKDAGMKYIVLTSKHHDGFCLWDTKMGKYNIVDATPYKKDLIKDLSNECKKQGIRLCFYYSIMDWHHPDANPKNINNTPEERKANFPKYREEYMKPQLKELLTAYDNVGVLWFDGEWIGEWTEQQGKDLYNYLRNIKPDLIINNRVGKGRNGFQGMNSAEYCGDFGTPEQEILEGTSDMDWESCMTMNDTWGFKKDDHNWKSSQTLIHNLIDIAAKGGNYLLNVGPTAEGLIPAASVERLKDMGDWMRINNEGIYGTHAIKKYKEGDNIRFTQGADNNYIYAFSYVWPGEKLNVRSIRPENGSEIYLLGYDQPLKWTHDMEKGLTILIPKEAQQQFSGAQAIAYTFKIKGSSAMTDTPQIGTGQTASVSDELFVDPVNVVIKGHHTDEELFYTTDGSQPTAKSKLYEGPFSLNKTTTVKAIARKKGMMSSEIVQATFTKAQPRKADTPAKTTPGIGYEYYEGEFKALPNFNQLTAAKKGAANDLGMGEKSREEHFAFRYTGYVQIEAPGIYTVTLASDDGSRLLLGGKLLINNDGLHSLAEKSAKIALDKGYHAIVLEYFQGTGGKELSLWVEGPGIPKMKIPSEVFYH